jgi:uncharacterized protein DUF5675
MDLTLVRWAYGGMFTLGALYGPGIELATLERPWIPDPDTDTDLAGKEYESCVPDGEYVLRPHYSNTYPEATDRWAYALVSPALGVYYSDTEIPKGQRYGRSKVLIHPANYVRELQGCIAPGLRHHYNVEPTVQNSGDAMTALRAKLGKATHRLIIRPTSGTQKRG